MFQASFGVNRIESYWKIGWINEKTRIVIADSKEISLKSLSNLAIFARQNDASVFPYIFCADAISRVLKYLSASSDLQEVYYVTIFFHNLQLLLTKDIMTQHKAKVKVLLNEINPKDSMKELLMVWKAKQCGHFELKKKK